MVFYDLDSCLLGHLVDPAIGSAIFNGFFLEAPETLGIGADADEFFLEKCENWKV